MNLNNKKFFITGATGFIGSVLIQQLLRDNFRVSAAVLAGEDAGHLPSEVERVVVQPLSASSDYTAAVQDVDIVIHLAARVHIMQDTATNPLQEFRKVNRYGTERLAMQAAEAGVRRFVFMSTIGVNGNNSGSRAFTESDDPRPYNPYSVSKFEAEIGLREISEKTGMEMVIVRAPLVYGPGNPGNFFSLLRVITKGIPLPLASVGNVKSFLYVVNLTDALVCCATHPNAAGQLYLVSDDEYCSTQKLIRSVATALGRPARLFPFPQGVMRLAGRILGKSDAVERLVGSLQVDSSKIRRELGWTPPFTMDQGLWKTAEWFKKTWVTGGTADTAREVKVLGYVQSASATLRAAGKESGGRTNYASTNTLMKRLCDYILALLLLAFFSLPMLIVALLVRFTSTGPVLYWSDRVGRHNVIFPMPKFRTMRINTPAVATHLLTNADQFLTPIGKFLRKSSLDELPQLFSIIAGHMSFVGPRPALFNQDDLIALRAEKGIQVLTPGLTGWAQVNGRDELPIPVKVTFDEYYLQHRSFQLDLKIMAMTFIKVLKSDGVKH